MPPQIQIPPLIKELFPIKTPFPSIIRWNRLEGRPRRADFDRSLRAEVRDPLWMLCRQWQFGEFTGEDAGSAIAARTQVSVSKVNRFAGQGAVNVPFDGSLPLETLVENEPIPLDLLTRAQMARHWFKLIAPIGDFKSLYLQQFPFVSPAAGSEAEAQLQSNPQAAGTLVALKGRLPDGGRIYAAMTAHPDQHAAWLASAVADVTQRQRLQTAAAAFLASFQRTYNPPRLGDPDRWAADYLEYQFSCSAPSGDQEQRQTVLTAQQYASGHLDWYSFDVDAASPGTDGTNAIPELQPPLSFVSNPILFDGMPAARWWEFEDGRVDFGNLKPNTTDLATLILADFSLICGNDWSVIPYSLPRGSLSQVLGVVVTDVFGLKTLVRPAGATAGTDLMHWGLFNLNVIGTETGIERLFLPPSAPKPLESDPIEKIIFIRDEMSSMVWGIEATLPAPDGGTLDGFEAAKALQTYLVSLNPPVTEPSLLDTGAAVAYRLGQTVPENWIPFIPIHKPGSTRDIRLQRAAMPRIIPGYPELPVEPRGAFLRPGLDQTNRQSYFVNEEEVPQAGITLTRQFQRVRWTNGRVITWLGRRKHAGFRFQSGQGSSGLSWDSLVPR